jgi:hypothetical protein
MTLRHEKHLRKKLQLPSPLLSSQNQYVRFIFWRRPGLLLIGLPLLFFITLLADTASSLSHDKTVSPFFPNLVPNPGFETDVDKDGKPDGWHQVPAMKPSHGKTEIQKGLKGERSLVIASGGSVTWKTRLKNIKPGRHYLLTFWVKREGWKDGEYPFVHIFGRKILLNELFSWGGWRKVRRVVQAREENETLLAFSANKLAHGLAIDQVKLRELAFTNLQPAEKKTVPKGRPTFTWSFTPSELVFRLKIKLSTSPALLNPTVIELMSPGKLGVRLLRQLPEGEWYWNIRSFLGVEEVAHSDIKSFRVLDGNKTSKTIPKSIRVDPPNQRTSFFPIGMFDARPSGFAELKAAGFNSVLIGDSLKTLKAANRNGLKAIFSHKNMNGAEFNLLARIASQFPALLGWYIEDEAEGRGVPPSAIWRKTASTRNLTPPHPTGLALLRSNQARYYGDAVDVVMVDPYPVPTQPLTWVSDSIENVRRQLGPNKQIWAIIQAFSWGLERHYPKDKPGRFPTLAEERAMTYLAIIHGARGIIYFADEHARRSAGHWANLKKLAGELNCIYPLLAANEKIPQPTLVSPEMDSRGKPTIHFLEKKLTANNSPPAKKGCPPLPPENYLIALNTRDKPTTMRLQGLTTQEGHAFDIFTSKKIKHHRNGLQKTLKPYGVGIWRLGRSQ